MILGLTGYAQSGKDTVANYLVANYGFTRIAFADKLKELAMRANPFMELSSGEGVDLANYVADNGWEVAKQEDSVRRFLQTLGEGARQALGDTVWINALNLAIYQSGYSPDTGKVVIPDVRYPNEMGVTNSMWRVDREGVGPVNSHSSEAYVEEMPVDRIIRNDGTLEDLYREIDSAFLVGGSTDGS